MTESMQAAWQQDEHRRVHVLDFLVTARPSEGFSYVLKGLDDPGHSVRSAAYIALHSYVMYGLELEPAIIDRLVRTAEDRGLDGRERDWALLVLERCKADFPAWIEEFALNESDATIRSKAEFARLNRGDTSQLSLLVRELKDPDVAAWLAGAVWSKRHVAPLSPGDQTLLRRVVRGEVNRLRRSHDGWYRNDDGEWHRYRNAAALVLLGWLVDGVAATSRDIARAEEFVECRRRLYAGDRVRAVKLLSSLEHPGVVPALRRLQDSRFASVRRAATKALQAPKP